jgi:ABC-type multidrug transport system ATPase subunit
MKRRFMIAKALIHRPQLLILDEPTAGVDVELRHDLWAFVREINRAGTTILLTTHYLEEAESLCRNVAIIDHGEIVKNRFDDGSKSYSFKYKDGEVENISKMFNTDFWNYGKLISGVLRHGMPIHHVIEMISTLSFKEDHINTWKVGVTRALKKFIPDGKPVGVKCKEPECGSTNVLFEEGCMKCLDCGSSKCG